MIKRYFPLLILALLSLFSCRSSKELIFLNDVSDQETITQLPAQETEYTLKPGDILYVSIKSLNNEVNQVFNPESVMETATGTASYQKFNSPSGAYLNGYEINVNGEIVLPILGNIQVAGLTLAKVIPVVQKRADEYIKDAIVNVKLLNNKITVLGEVRSPGVYYNYNNTITVIEAIAMASGNTDFAAIKNVVVVRPVPEGSKSYKLDLSSKNIYLSEAFYLQPNDYVFVQPDKQKNIQLNSQAYSILLSSLSVLIAVLGFVLN